jgi:hypothetical protein
VRSLPQADAGGGAPGEPGFGHGARVVTAAIIMISVFAGFIPAPDAIIESIEFALGVAVLFDALIIRNTVVPAAMVLLGRSAWWLPCWLDRLLPDVDVDVEGEKLRHQLDDAAGSDRSAPYPCGKSSEHPLAGVPPIGDGGTPAFPDEGRRGERAHDRRFGL